LPVESNKVIQGQNTKRESLIGSYGGNVYICKVTFGKLFVAFNARQRFYVIWSVARFLCDSWVF